MKGSYDRVKISRIKNRDSGGGRIEAQIPCKTMEIVNDLLQRTGMTKSELIDVALILLHESMDNGLILHSRLDQ